MQTAYWNNYQTTSKKQSLVNRYNFARSNLLLVISFSVLNILLLVLGSSSYFLFSASVPYLLVTTTMLLCGLFPLEFYTGELSFILDLGFLDISYFIIALVITILILALYLLSFLLSKKKVGWLIFALIFFIIDTAILFIFYGFSTSIIIDTIFHVYIIVSFIVGLHAHFQLKKLPEEEPAPITEFDNNPNENLIDSIPLRSADFTVKSRTLLEYDAFGHKIIYRRVKKTNELVIDGNVYGEYTALLERTHMLTANLDGHAFAVGLNFFSSSSYLMIDGQIVANKVRLV